MQSIDLSGIVILAFMAVGAIAGGILSGLAAVVSIWVDLSSAAYWAPALAGSLVGMVVGIVATKR